MSRVYEFCVLEELSESGYNALEGLTVVRGAQSGTVLRGMLRDQAAFHGVLMRIRDLSLTLISVSSSVVPDRSPIDGAACDDVTVSCDAGGRHG